MRFASLLLAVSMAINIGLLAAFAVNPALLPPAARELFVPDSVFISSSEAEREAAKDSARRKVEAARTKADVTALADFWSTLESDDLATLVANLRAAGFSPAMVRTIVNARMDARVAVKIKALMGSANETPFWQTQPMNSWNNSKFFEEMNQLYRDRSRVLREVLGDDVFSEGGRDPKAAQRRQFGDLPKEKIDLVQRIADDYAEMSSQVRASTQGITLPEDREKLALLEREKRVDLAAILTPEELEAYEMRTATSTARLRTALTFMDATEEEFRAIYQIQAPFADALYPQGNFAPEMGQQRRDAQKQVAEQLKAVLGETRYADFSRSSNPEFQQLSRLAQRENIPAETAVRVFNLRDSVTQDASRIFNDNTQSADQKRAALRTLAQTTKGQILTSLGPTVGNAYVNAANWISVIENGGSITFGPTGAIERRQSLPQAGPPPAPSSP